MLTPGWLITAALAIVMGLGGCSSVPVFPQLSVDARGVLFASQLVGSAPTTQIVGLSNTGNAPLLISSAAVTAGEATAFSVKNQCTTPLNPGASCSIVVDFAPPAVGSFAATLEIVGNDNASASVPLEGSGIAPVAQFSSSELSFPSTDSGYASDPSSLRLSNVGTAPMDLSGLNISGAEAIDFKLTGNTCPQSLATGASCSLEVTFNPAAATAYSAILSISGNDGNTPQSVTLSGTGAPDTALSAWNYAYKHCQTEPVNVLVLGDSRSIIDATILPGGSAFLADTFGQKWADRMAAALQATCGSHGSGLVPLLPVAQGQFLNGDYYQIQGTWTTNFGLGPQQFGGVPANMVLRTTSAATISFGVAQPFDHLNAYCVAGPGLNPWTLVIDGTAAGTCGGPSAAEQAVLATSSAVPLGTHAASLTCGTAPCAAYGLETVSGTSGISVHNLSVGSCAAECFGQNPAAELAFSDLISGHHLLIVEEVTNDPGVGYPPDSFAASLGNIIQHERALPKAPSVLIYAPLQDIIGGQGPYYPVLALIANGYSTAFFDLRERYGYGFLPQYFGPDGAHENNEGHAVVYDAVMSTITPAK